MELSKLIPFNTHAHTDGSNFRLKDSIMKVEQLVDISYAKGHNGVCLTDHETVSMHIRIMQYVEEQKKKQKLPEDFVLALGNEIYLVDSIEEVRDEYKSGITKFPHFVLIAKNKEGHKQIRQLSTKAWLNSFRTGQMERVPTTKEELSYVVEQNKGNLIATTACAGGEFLMLINMLLNSEEKLVPTIKQAIHSFVSFNLGLFGEDFYIEIQPTIDPQLKLVNTEAIRISKAYGIKWTFATDAHYQTKDRRGVHESFLNSKDGERELSDFYATTYIMTTDEMWDYFKDYILEEDFIAGMKVNQEIRYKIKSYTLQHEVVVPEIQLKKFELNHMFLGYYGQYEYISNFANSEHEQDRWFLKMIEDGFVKKNQEFNEENLGRINTELKELWLISINLKQRLSSYYNLVEYIVDLMWDEKRGNSLVGIARGSVTGYYTCYLIGITQMNPIQWELPHWRHLESTRPELPKQNWAYKVNV